MISLKIGGIIAAAFIAGAFVASPELRAYAANTVGSADIINNSIQSVDIKDGEVKTDDIAPSAVGSLRIKDNDVKAQDIAPDAVGASELAADSVGGSELQAVTKLLFGQCVLTNSEATSPLSVHVAMTKDCTIAGTDSDDSVIVTLNDMNVCLDDGLVQSHNGFVRVHIKNECSIEVPPGAGSTIGIVVYDK
jgi:hypothetical protein